MSPSARRSRFFVVLAAAVVIGVVSPRVQGQQAPQARPGIIPSLVEPGQGLAIRRTSAQTGLVTFAAATGQGLLLPGMAGTSAADRATAFADFYGRSFGIDGRRSVVPLRAAESDALGQDHQRLRQVHDGVPVTAGELIVHLRGDRVIAANGHALSVFPPSVTPAVAAGTAQDAAATMLQKHQPELAGGAQYSQPRLEVFNRGMIDEGVYPSRLAWFVEASGESLREYIWVDAQTGGILLNFSQLAEAKNRAVHNMNHGTPPATPLPGAVARTEGQPASADVDVNQAYDYSGLTYDYYLANHGRDSFDGTGGLMRSSVHYGTAFENAFWNGTQMVYGDGFTSADDVVAHELTHAVTERSANLLYYNQSGALNESFSDIFGETVDLTDGVGTDTAAVRWKLGEDLTTFGVIRDMMTPTLFGDPGKMSDSGQFVCRSDAATSNTADAGGVHSNSGIPNHAYALMVDGGTYNGRAITGIGTTKAGKIQYRALTTYLTSGANFTDNAAALNQSCTDLVGTVGITTADCSQVASAIAAVEMNNTWPCAGATPPPATFCPAGGSPVAVFEDGFETGIVNWTAASTTATQWAPIPDFASRGHVSAYGEDADFISDHRLAMTNPVTIPAGGRLSFSHAFEFEHSTTLYFDGGVLEYSTNGTTWTDAGSLIDAGQAYNGTIATGGSNPLQTRTGFVRSSFGYTGTRLNLASLAGQSVRFRFRVGTDIDTGSLGWAVDDVQLYSCGASGGTPPTTVADSYGTPFGTPLNVAAPGVLGNDNTNGGGAMTAAIASPAANGAVVLSGNGGFTYTPNAGFSGGDSFTYRASNSAGPGNVATVTITVAGPSTGPTPPSNFRVIAMAGNVITFAWTPAASGTAPTGYQLEGGVAPGQVLGMLPLGLTPAATLALPSGAFYLRLRTLTAGGPSAASNEILTYVNVPAAPSAPANLLGMVVGATVNLAWTPTFGGGLPTTTILDVTGAVSASVPLGPTDTFSFAGVPAGTYTFAVRAGNAAGTSAASNPVTLTFPSACSGAPQIVANFLAYNTGSTLFLNWDPPASGAAPTSYVLSVSGAFVGAIPMSQRGLSSPVPPGTYNFSVVAVNACGTGASTAVQTVTVP